MADYYGYQHYYSSPYVGGYYRDEMEYDGYDNAWVLGREKELPYVPRGGAYHYSSKYGGHDGYHHREHSWSRSPPRQYYEPYDVSKPPRPTWPTERPVRLRISLCCEGCRWRLDEELRDIEGVYDVDISGWSNAVVTVRGTAPAHWILEKARRVSKTAEFWSDSMYYRKWY